MAAHTELYDSLADRMSRDAVLFADEVRKAEARTECARVVGHDPERQKLLALWLIRSETKYGSDEPITWRYLEPDFSGLGRSRQWFETHLSGFVMIRFDGSIGLCQGQGDNGPFEAEIGGANAHLSHFVTAEAFSNPRMAESAYEQWRADLVLAGLEYTTKFARV